MGANTERKKKKINANSWDCPGIWGWILFMCFFFSRIKKRPEKKKKRHINKNYKIVPPTQSRDNPAHLFMFICFFFPCEFLESFLPDHFEGFLGGILGSQLELSIPKKSQSQKNRCVFNSQNVKSQARQIAQKKIVRKSQRKPQKNSRKKNWGAATF